MRQNDLAKILEELKSRQDYHGPATEVQLLIDIVEILIYDIASLLGTITRLENDVKAVLESL